MSTPNHSPAPWEYDQVQLRPERSAYAVVRDAKGKILFDSLNSDVAEILRHDDGTHSDEQGRRDLALASAAPELLAALELMMKWQRGVKDLLPDGLFEKMRTAIAKAKGRSS